MTQEQFNIYKNRLISVINKRALISDISTKERNDLATLLDILGRYTFENRITKKGLLSRILVDSLEVGNEVGEQVHLFDQSLT